MNCVDSLKNLLKVSTKQFQIIYFGRNTILYYAKTGEECKRKLFDYFDDYQQNAE